MKNTLFQSRFILIAIMQLMIQHFVRLSQFSPIEQTYICSENVCINEQNQAANVYPLSELSLLTKTQPI